MSRFFSGRHAALVPYTPGEQPRDRRYTKLNTNESPFPPSDAVRETVAREAGRLQLYPDPDCADLRAAAAALYGVEPENLLPVNGSDEILYYAFLAFCDRTRPVAFADISYGFYPVYAAVNHIPAHVIPLREDFSVDPADYIGLGENIVLANPNAPTGMALPAADVERIAASNPDNVVIVDEAYVDFGGESCVGLLKKYDNLLVTQTFSKSRSLAGARLGFGIGNRDLIRDLDTIRCSVNPYNVSRMAQAAGIAAIRTDDYYAANSRVIAQNRDDTARALEAMGFEVLPSKANFVFARSRRISGGALYRALRDRGVLVRWFDRDRIRDFIRVTIGDRGQMDIFLESVRAILEEKGGVSP